MATQQPPETTEQQIDVTAAEWLMIMVTGFTGIFAGPFAVIPGAVVVGMFAYRLNPELMKASAAGKWVRGLLPAPAPEQDVPAQPSSSKAGATATTAQPATRATAAKGKAAKALPVIELEQLASATTILLVGSRGSRKTTLLRAILSVKREPIMVYDPHAYPTAWPMAAMLHNTEESISKGMASAYKCMLARREEMRSGVRTEGWPKFTLAADEWGSIVSSVKLPKEIDMTPGQVSTELMKQGRKFEIGFVAGAHGLTNASLGCVGDQEAFFNSFDWIIHMGAFTRRMLPLIYLERWDEMPMGTNEQGGTFPLCVACEHRASGEVYLLDMRGLAEMVDTRPATQEPIIPAQRAQANPDSTLLASMFDVQPGVNVQRPFERSNTVQPRSDAVQDRSSVQANGAERPKSDTNEAAERSETLSPDELRRLVKAVELFKLNGSKQRAIETAFGCKKGGSSVWQRASFLFDRAVADEEAPEPSADDEDEPPEWFSRSFDG